MSICVGFFPPFIGVVGVACLSFSFRFFFSFHTDSYLIMSFYFSLCILMSKLGFFHISLLYNIELGYMKELVVGKWRLKKFELDCYSFPHHYDC